MRFVLRSPPVFLAARPSPLSLLSHHLCFIFIMILKKRCLVSVSCPARGRLGSSMTSGIEPWPCLDPPRAYAPLPWSPFPCLEGVFEQSRSL